MEKRLLNIEKILENQDSKLDHITEALTAVAVQHERLNNLEEQTSRLQKDIRKLLCAGGIISDIKEHQASCPRNQIKNLWYITVPVAAGLLTVSYKILLLS